MAHKTADEYLRLGDRVRFCQRCGLAHPLADFDGAKRSCRKKLENHNARRRKAPTSPNTSSGGEIEGVTTVSTPFHVQALSPSLPPPDEGISFGGFTEVAAMPAVSTANSTSCNERVCCTSGDECVCCECDSNNNNNDADVPISTTSLPAAAAADSEPRPTASIVVGTSSTPCAAPAATDRSDDVAAAQPAHCDDSDAISLPAGPSRVDASAAAVRAVAEAELAALRVTDAAMYALIVQQQMMRAQLLLATAGMMQRTRSAMSLSRMDSSGSITPMVM